MDHAAGTREISQSTDGLKIYGGDPNRIEAIDVVVQDEQKFNVGQLSVRALSTP